MRCLEWDCSLASPPSHSHSASDMPSGRGTVCAAAVTTTAIETARKATLHSDEEVIEFAYDRRRLESLKDAVIDTQELYSRCEVTVRESEDLLRRLNDLLMRRSH